MAKATTLRAKLRCNTIAHYEHGAEEVKLFAVYAKEGENAAFAKASPSANFTITIDNPAAKGFFEPGQEYYFDINPARPAS
jgi:hypothetical protein